MSQRVISKDYIAGLFDSHGSFSMNRVMGENTLTVRPWRYQCYARIDHREGWLLDLIRNSLGYGWTLSTRAGSEKHSPGFVFGVSGDGLRYFCRDVGPLLHIKSRQMQLVSEICEIKSQITNRVSDEQYDRQVEIWNLLRILNAKGPKDRSHTSVREASL